MIGIKRSRIVLTIALGLIGVTSIFAACQAPSGIIILMAVASLLAFYTYAGLKGEENNAKKDI